MGVQGTIDDLMEPGLHTVVAGIKVLSFPSYRVEVDSFSHDGNAALGKPFVNQDRTLLEVLRILTTDYPYAVLLGDSGIGKSMILDYVVGILTGRVGREEVARHFPDAVRSIDEIIAKSAHFEHRDYLLLPNLFEPMSPVSIAYTNADGSRRDRKVADDFSMALRNHLNNYAAMNRRHMRKTMSVDEFEKWADSSLAGLFASAYRSITNNSHFLTFDENHAVVVVGLSFGRGLSSKGDIKAEVSFEHKPGARLRYGDLKSAAQLGDGFVGVNRDIVIHGLGTGYFPHALRKDVVWFLQQLNTVDVVGEDGVLINDYAKGNYAISRLNGLSSEIKTAVLDGYRNGNIRANADVLAHVTRTYPNYLPARRISPASIDHLVSGVSEIVGYYGNHECSDELKRWMASVGQFFSKERYIVTATLESMLAEIEEKERKGLLEVNTMADEAKRGKRAKKQVNDGNNKKQELYAGIRFWLPHGVMNVFVEQILNPHYLSNIGRSTGYTETNMDGASVEGVFGSFSHLTQDMPPHRALVSLGKFFRGGILVFRDTFGDFVQLMAEHKEASMRQRFLEYLQTGVLAIANEGVSFTLESPKILLGSDNGDPFMTLYHDVPRDETGFRSRISVVNVPSFAPNTGEARYGTLEVIVRAMNDTRTDGPAQGRLVIDPEVMHALLCSQLAGQGLVSLRYRDLWQLVQNTAGHATQKGYPRVSMAVVREMMREKFPPTFLFYVEEERTRHAGYFSESDRSGMVNGVSVGYNENGFFVARMPVQAYVTVGRNRNDKAVSAFQHVDISSGLAGEGTVMKGFELAADYMRMLLEKISPKWKEEYDWVVKTQYAGNWSLVGGASASAATVVAQLSALAGDTVYKNRFVTGTLNPADGSIGPVGAVYLKSAVPNRLAELALERGGDGLMYMLLPAQNVEHLSREMLFDPFGVAGRVVCLPVDDIAQLYYLATCGQNVTRHQWADLGRLAAENFEGVRERISANLEKL